MLAVEKLRFSRCQSPFHDFDAEAPQRNGEKMEKAGQQRTLWAVMLRSAVAGSEGPNANALLGERDERWLKCRDVERAKYICCNKVKVC